jgi:lipoprotein-anchoring transpeptidase ErfK/SrfK
LIPELPDILPILPEAATMRLVLNLSQRRVFVYEGSDVKASYPVAVGKPGWETPPGSYQVISMLQDPGWISPFTGEEIPPGPDNPLGDRWIGFWTDGTNYIGFHGTPNRDSVGQAASHGCVRMFNEHIRQLYEMVDMGTPVIVEN